MSLQAGVHRLDEPLLVLFDCDGTLIDSAGLIHAAISASFAQLGLTEPSRAQTRAIIGLSLDKALAVLLPQQDRAALPELAEFYKRYFTQLRQQNEEMAPVFPQISQLLTQLHQSPHIVLGMVTGKSRRGVAAIVEKNGWDFFSFIRTADDCPSKPHPAMVLECCAESGIDAQNCYVVGDTTYDMQMAKAAKAQAIGVRWGYHGVDDLRATGADKIVDQASDLLFLTQ